MNAHVAIDLLLCTFSRIERWRVLRPRRPFWRMYWNRSRCGTVRAGRSGFDLGPARMVLVAPDTQFEGTHTAPMEHFFAHFTASHPYDAVTSLVLSVDLASTERRAFRTLSARLEGGESLTPGDVAWVVSRAAVGLSRVPHEFWPPPRRDERIAGAARAMEADPARPWRNPELARAAHMATNAFIRKFKEVMGVPPQAFLMGRRLDRARILLEHSDRSVETIAGDCGFCSRSHLATAFAARFNTPPGAYRRMTRAT